MINAELYLSSGRPLVILNREDNCDPGAWARIQEAFARGIVDGSPSRTDVRADVFLAEVEVLREVRALFGQKVTFGPTLHAQLQALASDRKIREASFNETGEVDPDSLKAELIAAGFVRTLKPFQLQNLAVILRLPHGADFSVPGAGKTTVALANFCLNRSRGLVKRLLVVGPIAAFGAWKEDSQECLAPAPTVVVHGGPDTAIPRNADILLTNYNRVASDYDRIRAFIADQPTQVILDEAHRIKRGGAGVHGRAVLDLAYVARRRDVLTGTPAPQGAFDLIALMQFLYPGQDRKILPQSAYQERDGREESVLIETRDSMSRYFVRTTKSRLDLPPTKFNVVREGMRPIQQAIYDALIGRWRAGFRLSDSSRREFDRLGRIVMYLLEAATNPLLLPAGSDEGDDCIFLHPPLPLAGDEPIMELLQAYHRHETPWKYDRVAQIVADAASRGEKVIVWSNFVRNLKSLAKHLEVFEPAMIHGGVPAEDNAPPKTVTRESELFRFRNSEKCSVLLANPAACGEGISLHHECHHAVYLDRTFNAGQFLQSQDRIHRLGLDKNVITEFTILTSIGTIDDSVDWRLRDKVKALSKLMDDPGLVQVALPEPDVGDTGTPMHKDDLQAVIAHLSGV
ncbi:DEAD/DEAH box helicase [Janthinobacterium svalbardensis]|uniref:DEAD/DEAH box helicase n=1 Tax=Janthinobacterium svalbardensis TaxID=368607 RepID=UPI002FCD9686